MRKILRDYQQDALDKLKIRLKATDYPLLMTLSVGAGKSLCISELLSWASGFGIRCLCLTLNSTLIKQNADTHKSQNGNYGINCSSMKSKSTEDLIIFASPNSICQQIRNKQKISTKQFGIIVVDEAHQISQNPSSMYQRIFNHYRHLSQLNQYKLKIVGFTGTPFRGKNESIVGENAFFKEEVCNISAQYLIERGFLVKPRFGIPPCSSFDFKNVRITSNGKFNGNDLQQAVDNSIRLTGEIMLELQKIDCKGMFIFCSSVKHCYEALKSLPKDKSAVIVGSTAIKEREEILTRAQAGKIKYLVSVSILMVGVDVPLYDYCAWLRPTESLILYTQGIGRVLRLHSGKTSATVLDFAQNLQRHGDIDDPIINQAVRPSGDNNKDYCIPCYDCNTLNTLTARRCIGIDSGGDRCNHYFEFKPCKSCGIENDIVSRQCRSCGEELIDPNAKLVKGVETFEFAITRAKYFLSNVYDSISVHAYYYTAVENQFICESYSLKSEKSKNIFYAKFIKNHVRNPSDWYMKISNASEMNRMLNHVQTPYMVQCIKSGADYKVIKKHFLPDTVESLNH